MERDPLASFRNVRDQFDLVGELGQDPVGTQVYLARERSTGELVALRPGVQTSTGSEPAVVVYRTLGVGLPAGAQLCPICGSRVTDWRRFCGRCGSDVSGAERAGSTDAAAREHVRAAVHASGRPYELLGDMRRGEGGAPVYFARDADTGDIVALTLEPTDRGGSAQGGAAEDGYALNVTALRPAASLADSAQRQAPISPAAAGAARADVTADPDTELKVCPSCGGEFGGGVRFCPRDGSGLHTRARTDELVGEVIAERYHVVRRIGQGGMGQVYLAEHVKMGRACAVKVMNRTLTQDVDAVSRFAREATSASRINHPNIATIYDFGETRDRLLYLVMEYVDGEALSRVLEREKRLPVERAIRLARQIADALAAAHREGVVHRDLKPDNILIGRTHAGEDRVKVVDFGIAKAIHGGGEGLTRTGLVVGTPRYMSPEQLTGDAVDGRSDVYALGCILFEMLVGEHAFASAKGELLITRRLTEAPPHPHQRNGAVPADVDALVVRAMARLASERFGSADELRDALDAAQQRKLQPWWRAPWLRPRLHGGSAERQDGAASAETPVASGLPWLRTSPDPTPAPDTPHTSVAPASAGEDERGRVIDRPHATTDGQILPPQVPPAGVEPRPMAFDASLIVRSTLRAPPGAREAAPPAVWQHDDEQEEVGPSDATAADPPGANDSASTAASPGPGPGSGSISIDASPTPYPTGRSGAPRLVAAAALLVIVVSGAAFWALRPNRGTVAGPITPAAQAEQRPDDTPVTAVPPPVLQTDAEPQPQVREPQPPPEPRPGRLRIMGALPADARILVDGVLVARPLDGVLVLAPGMRAIRVELAGHEPATLRFELIADRETEWRPRLVAIAQQAAPAAPPQPRPETTAPRADPPPTPRSFAAIAQDEVQRVARELEARQIRPSMTSTLESEWRRVFEQTTGGELRVGIREVQTDSVRRTATFYLVAADRSGRSVMPLADYEAHFLPVAGGWRLVELIRK